MRTTSAKVRDALTQAEKAAAAAERTSHASSHAASACSAAVRVHVDASRATSGNRRTSRHAFGSGRDLITNMEHRLEEEVCAVTAVTAITAVTAVSTPSRWPKDLEIHETLHTLLTYVTHLLHQVTKDLEIASSLLPRIASFYSIPAVKFVNRALVQILFLVIQVTECNG